VELILVQATPQFGISALGPPDHNPIFHALGMNGNVKRLSHEVRSIEQEGIREHPRCQRAAMVLGIGRVS